MWKLVAGIALWIAAFGLGASAGAAPVSFSGNLWIQVGSLAGVAPGGSGYGTSGGPGGSFSIPASVFSIQTTVPVNPQILVIDGFAIGGPGVAAGAHAPVSPGTNKALAWNGVTGTMGLDASAYLLTSDAQWVVAAVPLGIVGVGGAQMFSALGMLIMGTVFANPYQLGMVTVMGALQGVPATLMGTGYDNRTIGGEGSLQLVSPAVVALGALGSVPVLATFYSSFSLVVPEPTTLVLVGAGLVAIGALGRRNVTRRSSSC